MNIIIERLSKLSKRFLLITGILLVLMIGILDFWAGPEIGFSLFYLIPIYLVTWFGGRRAGIVMSFASMILWFLIAVVIPARALPASFIYYWEAFVRLGFFIVVVFLETALKNALSLARVDPLTMTGNRRYFFESAEIEIKKLSRHKRPFTAAYIDIDNFKAVNDTLGHEAGDSLLRTVAQTMRENIRSTDIFARLGGDEFVLLLPETDADSARKIIPKFHGLLKDATKKYKRTVALSIGAVTFNDPPDSVDEIIKRIDSVMYAAKKEGTDLIKYDLFR